MRVRKIGIAAGGESAQQIERRRGLPVGLQLPARIGMGAAKAQGIAMPTASATRESIQALANNHPGDIDFSVLLLELARAAGMQLEPENVKVSDGL